MPARACAVELTVNLARQDADFDKEFGRECAMVRGGLEGELKKVAFRPIRFVCVLLCKSCAHVHFTRVIERTNHRFLSTVRGIMPIVCLSPVLTHSRSCSRTHACACSCAHARALTHTQTRCWRRARASSSKARTLIHRSIIIYYYRTLPTNPEYGCFPCPSFLPPSCPPPPRLSPP